MDHQTIRDGNQENIEYLEGLSHAELIAMVSVIRGQLLDAGKNIDGLVINEIIKRYKREIDFE